MLLVFTTIEGVWGNQVYNFQNYRLQTCKRIQVKEFRPIRRIFEDRIINDAGLCKFHSGNNSNLAEEQKALDAGLRKFHSDNNSNLAEEQKALDAGLRKFHSDNNIIR